MCFRKNIILVISFVILITRLFAEKSDSLKTAKLPKHYFKTTFNVDYYSTGKRDLMQDNFVAQKLKSYQVNQFAFGFNTPLFTKDFYKKDSSQISNFHLLLAGSYVSLTPNFEGITAHHLSKTTLGVRSIYNTGKKSIFYLELAPFTTKDNGYRYTRQSRFSTTLLYDCVVNKNFSFRVGYTRSFLFGNRYHLPYIGIRVGKLDGVNFSVQFPRSISFNVPIGKYVKTTLYTKPLGGVYTFANTDTVYYLNPDKKINFGRYEFLGGLRLDVYPASYFNFYLSAGFTSQNYIGMYSETFNKRNKGIYHAFYKEQIANSVYLNFGLVFKFGKTKSIYDNYNLYEAQDLNNKNPDNINQGNSQIPAKYKTINRIKPDEVLDLIETSDLY